MAKHPHEALVSGAGADRGWQEEGARAACEVRGARRLRLFERSIDAPLTGSCSRPSWGCVPCRWSRPTQGLCVRGSVAALAEAPRPLHVGQGGSHGGGAWDSQLMSSYLPRYNSLHTNLGTFGKSLTAPLCSQPTLAIAV